MTCFRAVSQKRWRESLTFVLLKGRTHVLRLCPSYVSLLAFATEDELAINMESSQELSFRGIKLKS